MFSQLEVTFNGMKYANTFWLQTTVRLRLQNNLFCNNVEPSLDVPRFVSSDGGFNLVATGFLYKNVTYISMV